MVRTQRSRSDNLLQFLLELLVDSTINRNTREKSRSYMLGSVGCRHHVGDHRVCQKLQCILGFSEAEYSRHEISGLRASFLALSFQKSSDEFCVNFPDD